MNARECFDLAAKAVTEQAAKNVGQSDANYQILWQQLYNQGKAHTIQNYIDEMLKTNGLSEHPEAYELQQAWHAQKVKEFNAMMCDPRFIDQVKDLSASERQEKAVAEAAEAAAQKLAQIASQANQAVASGTPVLPETYGDYTLDGKGLRKMAREDMTKFRYLNSVYGTAQVNQRLNS
jgi:hypothetical protein